MRSPVLLIAFNRPRTTAQVFEAIRNARPTRLYVAVDGPRPDRPHEAEICQQVQQITSQVDWPCTLTTLFRTTNLGCRTGVSSAIDWFFEHEPEGIILEDDCLPHPDFFRYCDDLLERYRNDTRIMTIGGSNFLPESRLPSSSYYYAPYFQVWGWASWRRAWSLYDVTMQRYRNSDKNQLLKKIFGRNIEARTYWRRIFDSVAVGKVDTWDYQWFLDCLINEGLTCLPCKNLISNIGFNEDATHTNDVTSVFSELRTESISFPLVAPPRVACDPEIISEMERTRFGFTGKASLKDLERFTKTRIRELLGIKK